MNCKSLPVVLFTDFGATGPYVGQVKAVLAERCPAAPVIDLMHDAPAFDPQAAAYLLAALLPYMPKRSVGLCVVDPGVGGARSPLVVEVDGRYLVGPDNGLLEIAIRRSRRVRAWRIDWRPAKLSATFHGRDLFAPIAAGLAMGKSPESLECVAIDPPSRPGMADDLARIIYYDGYGNAFTGIRVSSIPPQAVVEIGGRRLHRADYYAQCPNMTPFWYENSIGLLEISIAGGSVRDIFRLDIGENVKIFEDGISG